MKAITLSILAGIIVIIVLIVGLIIVNKQRDLLKRSQVEIASLHKDTKQLRVEFGKSLFRSNCGMCHARNKKDNLLEGVVNRMGEDYLKIYLTNQDSLVAANEKYAVAIKKEFGNIANSHNFKFTAQELQALIEYLK